MKVCTSCNNTYEDDKLFCPSDGTPLRPSGGQTADLVGQVIADRYHIQKKLGEGGMGQVYLAEHVKMGRRCAIKIMSPAMMKDPDAISRFNREAANASRIGHPNVCAIYDFGETPDGLIYLAMEFIEGRSLSGILEESGTLPLARAASLITQCADALQVAHDLGIVHRDLKPDNIMVITQRGKDTVKVVDFGIAKAVGAEGGGAQKVTKTGFVVGTPEYMSPEQLSGDPVDGRSDLYSLALVFYRMLTGSTPFPADSQQETMIKRLTDDPLPLAQARPDIRFPPQLQRVLDRALARISEERYPTAAEFARDVRALAGALTGPVDAEAGTQQMPSRPRAEAAPATSGALPATRIDPAIERERARAAAAKPAAPPAPAPAPAKKFPVVPVAVAVLAVALAGGGFAMKDKLFGTGKAAQPDTTQSDTAKPAGGGQPGGMQAANPDSLKPAADTLKLSHETTGGNPASGSNPGGGGKPAGGGRTTTNPPRDSAHGPVGTIPEATPTLPPPAAIENEDTRATARNQAIMIYFRRELSRDLRAKAAKQASVAYQLDGKVQDALDWADSSYRLKPDEDVKSMMDRLKAQLPN